MKMRIKHIINKRMILVLFAVMIFGTSGFALPENEPPLSYQFKAEEDEPFVLDVSKLVSDTWDDNFFSQIIIDTQNETIKVDNEDEKPIDSIISSSPDGEVSEDSLLIPIIPILEAEGHNVEYNEKTDSIIIDNGNETIDIDGISESQQNDYSKVQVTAGIAKIIIPHNINFQQKILAAPSLTANNDRTLLSVEQLDSLNYDVHIDGDNIILTKPFQTKRLVVIAASKPSGVKAETILTDGNGTYVMQFGSEDDTVAAYEKLRKAKNIGNVSPDKVILISSPVQNRRGAEHIQSDRYKQYLAGNNKTGQVTVAVVDTGVDASHPLLAGRILSGYDFYFNDSNPDDSNSHGTHVSSIVADSTPDSVKILPVKSFNDSGSSVDLIVKLGIDYAVSKGANVINMSFSGYCSDNNCLINQAVKNANNKGVICVAAAGNDSVSTDNACPARIQSCITVSALDESDRLANFSNYGSAVDIAAPGTDIQSSIPGGEYANYSGTSMAAPFVSAAAAMFKMNNIAATPAQIKATVRSGAVPLGVKGNDKRFGVGALNFGIVLGDNRPAMNISLDATSINTAASPFANIPVLIDADVQPINATDKSYTVTSSNPSVAVFENGYIIIKSIGSTTITFTIQNGTSDSCIVNVNKSDLWIDFAAKSYARGKGTQADPYLISTAEQLAKISADSFKGNLVNVFFKQINDIDLTGKIWFPIAGINKSQFVTAINYDGSGYKISNMKIDDRKTSLSQYSALFCANDGEIKNVNMIDVDIDNPQSVSAAICAHLTGSMSHCYSSGRIKSYSAGGLVGSAANWSSYDNGIFNCYSTADLEGTYAGGIALGLQTSSIRNCYFNGTVTAQYSGGIVAELLPYAVLQYSSGYVRQISPSITNCFSTTNLVWRKYKFVAYGFEAYPTITNSYYLETADSGISDDQTPYSTNIAAKPMSFFTDVNNFKNTGNWDPILLWDIDSVWNFSGSLPTLRLPGQDEINTSFEYKDAGDGITITRYLGNSPNVTVPEMINKKPVRYIGYGAFSEENPFFYTPNRKIVKSVKLSDNVHVIANSAFLYNTTLENITFGNGLKLIDELAFAKCDNLRFVLLPKRLEYMEPAAFYECDKLNKAYFLGPNKGFPSAIFLNPAKNFTIYYAKGQSGWTTPKWKEYNTKEFDATKVQIIELDKTKITLMAGKTEKLTANIWFDMAVDKAVTWSSSNNAVATVNNNGVVTAKAAGTANITVTAQDGSRKNDTCKITVVQPVVSVNSVKIYTPIYLVKGKTIKIPTLIHPANATNKTLTWSSSKTSVARVDSKGTVKGIKTGSATITVKAHNGKYAKCTVYVVSKAAKLKKITIKSAKKATLKKGKTLQIKVTLNPKYATGLIPKYSSNNKAVATVDILGKVKALKAGKATITVKLGRKSIKVAVTVT